MSPYGGYRPRVAATALTGLWASTSERRSPARRRRTLAWIVPLLAVWIALAVAAVSWSNFVEAQRREKAVQASFLDPAGLAAASLEEIGRYLEEIAPPTE